MQIRDAQSIGQLAIEQFHDPAFVRAIANEIMLLESVSNRREALSVLVERLLAADEIEAAANAARLAPDLTPKHYVNNVDPWFMNVLIIKIVDQLLDRRDTSSAAQLLDQAASGLNELARYEPSDLPIDPPWFQLTRRYRRIGMLERVYHIWDAVITWAQSIEQSSAIPDPAWFQPEDGSRFLVGIVAEMLELGQGERAQATAGAIRHEPHRAIALALTEAPASAQSQPAIMPGASAPTANTTVAIIQQLLTRRHAISADRANDLAYAGELLAAVDRDLLLQSGTPVAGLWEQVRVELASLLNRLDDPGAGEIAPRERMRAGQALGLLSDPRIPLKDAEWQASLSTLSTQFSASGNHYWRYVPAGRHWIGGWAEYDPYAGPMQRDQWIEQVSVAAFWLARLPVTIAQYEQFMADGYGDDAFWTPNGRQWRVERTAPGNRGEPHYHGANQPIVYVNWYEATAYCRWLNTRLATMLPPGYALRLPSEAEWEVAAACDGTTTRRPHPWGDASLTIERAVTVAWRIDAPAPVGLCPAGMSACGALDLAGNISEWSGGKEEDYPKRANRLADDHPVYPGIGPLSVPARGDSWKMSHSTPGCGVRHINSSDFRDADRGLRLALAPSPV